MTSLYRPLAVGLSIIFGLLYFSSSALALNWVYNGQSNDGSRFAVDMDSLEYSTPKVRYMYRQEPGGAKKTPNGLSYSYMSSQFMADCAIGTSTEISKNYMEDRGWLVATGTPNSQPYILSQNPNSVHTVLVNALCFLNKAGIHTFDLSLFKDWTDDISFNAGNDPRTALSRYTISPQSMQKKGDLLFFAQSITYEQSQLFGDRPYRTIVSVAAFNCRNETRSQSILSMFYQGPDQRAVGWGGMQNPDNFTAFSRYQNTEKFRQYCSKLPESRSINQVPAPSAPSSRVNTSPKPAPGIPVKPVEEEKRKLPHVRSDSLL
jgi:hypothetical protein